MNLTMIGTGYVGLVSGACFSEFGHNVVCVDTNPELVERLHNNIMPIYEPGLDELVARNVRAKRLSFTTSLAEGVANADAVFIAVGTPSRRGDGHADLSYVHAAARQIALSVTKPCVVVNKSTVPVGTARTVEAIVREAAPDKVIDVASNPEFLREGSAIEDFMRPDRVVCGVDNERSRDVLASIYRPLSLRDTPVMFTDRETAEVVKYAANAFLAMKISFINEVSDFCEKVGADVQQVASGIGLDKRIGEKFLHPGPGYGGSCFPKDTLALLRSAEEANAPLTLIRATVDINERRKKAMAKRIVAACRGSVAGKTIAILGLTFKPNTDDMRDSPSLSIIPELTAAGARVRAYDPEGMESCRKMLPDIDYCEGTYETMEGADALVVLTEWNEFRALDLDRVKSLLKSPVIVDLRNVYKPAMMQQAGFVYESLGRTRAAIEGAAAEEAA